METHTEGDGEVVIEERGGESQDREVVHLSPTNFDTARMPRTVSASVFTNVKTMATTLRVQINKGLKKCDKLVQDLQELDQLITTQVEEDSDNEEEFAEVQSEFSKSFENIKKANELHSARCFEIQQMCNFIIESEITVDETESNNKQEARRIMVMGEKFEEETEDCVAMWRKENGKWFKKRRRVKKAEVPQERGRG